MGVCIRAWLAGIGLLLISGVHAQDYPNKAVRIFVPFANGSGVDVSTRFFGDLVSRTWRQPVVVENRPGGSGVIAVMAVKGSPADGYTLLTGSNSPITINPVVMKNLPYDPLKELKPVFMFGLSPVAFVVNSSSSHRTVADLVAAAKKSQSPLQIGTYSTGYELVSAWFGVATGTPVTTVPYKGAAAVITDILGNQIPSGAVDYGGAMPHVKDGRLRVLATTADARHPLLPDVPTMKESGFPDFVNYFWSGIFVRAETPDTIVGKLYDAFSNAMASPEGRAFRATRPGVDVVMTPKDLQAFVIAEHDRFRRIAQTAGIKPQ